MLKEELQLLQEPGSYVGEVIKVRTDPAGIAEVHGLAADMPTWRNSVHAHHAAALGRTHNLGPHHSRHLAMHPPRPTQVMGKNKVLVKVHPEGKYVVDIDKDIDISKLTPGVRVALRNDSYQLHLLLPTKVDPLVSLMKVEKVPDSTYDMIGGCDQQIKEIKEVGFVGGLELRSGSMAQWVSHSVASCCQETLGSSGGVVRWG